MGQYLEQWKKRLKMHSLEIVYGPLIEIEWKIVYLQSSYYGKFLANLWILEKFIPLNLANP